MKKATKWIVLVSLLVMALALAACSPEGTLPDTGLEDAVGTDFPEAASMARQALADQLGVTVDDIQITSAEQVEWPDACLGLGGADQACAQVVTPGWRISMEANGQEYVFRTDETGSIIQEDPGEGL